MLSTQEPSIYKEGNKRVDAKNFDFDAYMVHG
jgi:hypothetical protein